MDILNVLKNNEASLLKIPNVTGVGIGEKDEKEVILVFVTHKVPESQLDIQQRIPKKIEGYDVDVKIQLCIGN